MLVFHKFPHLVKKIAHLGVWWLGKETQMKIPPIFFWNLPSCDPTTGHGDWAPGLSERHDKQKIFKHRNLLNISDWELGLW